MACLVWSRRLRPGSRKEGVEGFGYLGLIGNGSGLRARGSGVRFDGFARSNACWLYEVTI